MPIGPSRFLLVSDSQGKIIKGLDILIRLRLLPAESGQDNQSICGTSILRRALVVGAEMERVARLPEADCLSATPRTRCLSVLRLRVDERVVKRSYGWLAYARAPAVCLNY